MSVNYNKSADHWVRSSRFKLEGKSELVEGCEVSVRGERGRFRFVEHVCTEAGRAWICAWGPVTGGVGSRGQWRYFDPSKIKTVHRIAKGRV